MRVFIVIETTSGRLGRIGPAVGDVGASRTVYAIVLALVLIGALFVALGVWLVRATRVDPEFLAPLEMMSRSKWRRSDPARQRAMLDEVRAPGAPQVVWYVGHDHKVASDLPPPSLMPAEPEPTPEPVDG